MEAAANLRKGLEPPYTGLYNSYNTSDGAAMRAAPIGIVFPGDLAGAWMPLHDKLCTRYKAAVPEAVSQALRC